MKLARYLDRYLDRYLEVKAETDIFGIQTFLVEIRLVFRSLSRSVSRDQSGNCDNRYLTFFVEINRKEETKRRRREKII